MSNYVLQGTIHLGCICLITTLSVGVLSCCVSPTKQIVALLGDDVVLPCFLKTPVDASQLQLEWARTDLTPGFIYMWEKNKENVDDKQPSYAGRTSLSFDKLKHGDVSLTLFKVQLSDEGPYRCFIPQGTPTRAERHTYMFQVLMTHSQKLFH
uniref:Ig-like domain-containing protein n=1 Tax=Neolamprologus brichardi TaxID=32507 RepID=A0A3Q4H6V1_NEOBR